MGILEILQEENSHSDYCQKEGHPFKSCLAHFQKIEELTIFTLGNKDLDNNVASPYSGHLAVKFALRSSSS